MYWRIYESLGLIELRGRNRSRVAHEPLFFFSDVIGGVSVMSLVEWMWRHPSKCVPLPILRWRHNDHDGESNHQPDGYLLNRLFRRRSKKTSKLRVTGLCVGKSPGPVNSPHKVPVTRKIFPLNDVIMSLYYTRGGGVVGRVAGRCPNQQSSCVNSFTGSGPLFTSKKYRAVQLQYPALEGETVVWN